MCISCFLNGLQSGQGSLERNLILCVCLYVCVCVCVCVYVVCVSKMFMLINTI